MSRPAASDQGKDTGPNTSGIYARVKGYLLAHPVLAVALVAGFATAAVSVAYTNTSTVTTTVTPPPVQFLAGGDAGPSALTDYVTSYAISTNKTYFTATVKGVPEATLTIDSFVQLQNVDDASHIVTLSTPAVSNALISAYTIEFYDSVDTLEDTLTLTAGSPSASLTIPAGETFRGKLTLTLASGAGADNVAETSALSLTV